MLLGYDISTFNGNMLFSKSKTNGINFNIYRASFPSKFVKYFNIDGKFAQNSELSPQFFPSTAYHVFRPQWDGAWQADKFCELLVGKNIFKRIAVDVELNEFGHTKSAFQNQLWKFIQRLENNGYPSPIIYTRGSFWNPNVGNPSWASQYDLWVARYGTSQPWFDLDDPYRPLPWTTWTIWQWSADGNGLGYYYGAESNSIDLNYFNGSAEEFSEFSDTQLPPLQDDTMKYKVTTTKLNIRSAPNKNSADLGDLYLNNIIGVFNVTKDSSGNDWARLGLTQWAAINEKVGGITYTYMQTTEDPINRIDL